MELKEISELLAIEIKRTIDKIEHFEDEQFFAPYGVKWSMALQLMHLTRSVKPLNQALSTSKLLLRIRFGRPKRKSMSYEGIVARYKEAEIPAVTGFEPTLPDEPLRDVITDSFKKHHATLLRLLDEKWEDDNLDDYQVPHPAMGKLTIREMLYFMIHHLRHHQLAIDKIIGSFNS